MTVETILSAIEKASTDPQQALLNAAVLGLFMIALVVYTRLLGRLSQDGCRVRHDLFALPEALSATVLMALLGAGVAMHFLSAAKDVAVPAVVAPGPRKILEGMLALALPALALVLVIVIRGGRLRDVFGFGKVPVFRALLLALGLTLVALPLILVAKTITIALVGGSEPPQLLVQRFHDALTGKNHTLIATIAASAIFVAPVCEEIIFRGSFYPLIARMLGRVPAAIVCAVLFGAVHDTVTDIPSLAVLALCFTAAYERTGSLLVPIFMHAWFNTLSLVAMIWQMQPTLTP